MQYPKRMHRCSDIYSPSGGKAIMAAKESKRDKKLIQKKTGYDPTQYRAMTIMFVFLSLVNILCVIVAFSRSGFGLYQAEDALSHVAHITEYVHQVNERAQYIVLHCEDQELIVRETEKIDRLFQDIDEESEKYRQIDLTVFDPRLKRHFDNAAMDTISYHHALTGFLTELQSASLRDPDVIAETYAKLIEPLKNTAEMSMNIVFDSQSVGTYNFFVRSARQFVFVLLFLLLNLFVGLFGIHWMEKKARTAAKVVELEHDRVEKLREKTVNLAYCHILTGFKNYYGLEKDLSEPTLDSERSIALCRINKFYQINEVFSRERADEYVTKVSNALREEYSNYVDMYSTASDEFCFVFRKKITKVQLGDMVRQLVETISGNFDVDGVMISQTVCCCYYTYHPKTENQFGQVFNKLDRAMSVAREQNAMHGQNSIINVNSLNGME